MATERRRLTVTQWSHEIGISKQAGYKAVQRCGIPIEDGMVDAELATLLYKRRTRPQVRMRKHRTTQVHPVAPAATDDLMTVALDIARMIDDDPALMDEGIVHLRAVLAALDDEQLAAVLLPVAVWDRLCADLGVPQ